MNLHYLIIDVIHASTGYIEKNTQEFQEVLDKILETMHTFKSTHVLSGRYECLHD